MEKKVTEGPSRVGIVSKSWGTRTRPDLPHRVWAAEGWSSAPAWVSAWMEVAQTGVVARLLLEREPSLGSGNDPVQASGRTTTRFFCLDAKKTLF